MRSATQLDSAVFQLTPTRTRFELVIIANEKVEKITSGLLDPFLLHLKTAQDQIAKGGYSITLEPKHDRTSTWFTKGTLGRFIRFVSTPDVLERVHIIESEILHIGQAMSTQSNGDIGKVTVQNPRTNLQDIEGCNTAQCIVEEKAIVLYKPLANLPIADEASTEGGNSKLQLLRALDTRKNALQREQGMAFARAVAAGFDVNHVSELLLFAECFGAFRLLDACSKFINAWKQKQENSPCVKVEASEAISRQSDISLMNVSWPVLSNPTVNDGESDEGIPKSHSGMGPDSIGNESDRTAKVSPIPSSNLAYVPGYYPSSGPPWPLNSATAVPPSSFRAHPYDRIPHYLNYAGNIPFPPHPYIYNDGRGMRRRHSVEGRESSDEMVVLEPNSISGDEFESVQGASRRLSSRRKARQAKRHSGIVAAQNVNYNASRKYRYPGSESQSSSGSTSDDAKKELQNSLRSSKGKHHNRKTTDTLNLCYDEGSSINKGAESAHWQEFQDLLLRDVEKCEHTFDNKIFTVEQNAREIQLHDGVADDALAIVTRCPSETPEEGISEFQSISRRVACIPNSSNDEFIIRGRGEESNRDNSINDPLVGNGFDGDENGLNRVPLINMADESFILPPRLSVSVEATGINSRMIDIELEQSFVVGREDIVSDKLQNQINYEPDDLNLLPDREFQKSSTGFDPALHYEMQICADKTDMRGSSNAKLKVNVKDESKKYGIHANTKVISKLSDKKTNVGTSRKGHHSKSSPVDEARARADRLRSFKADMQKIKLEKEVEEQKRLETLKLERQKRIEARNKSNSSSPLLSKRTTKLHSKTPSLHSHEGSKFSNAKASRFSPYQKIPSKPASLRSQNSTTTGEENRLKNGLSRSASSLHEAKKSNKDSVSIPEASKPRFRRLSEPKASGSDLILKRKNGLSLSASSLHEANKNNEDSVSILEASKQRSRRLLEPKVSGSELILKPKKHDGPERRKVSSIISLDKSKGATLPELKLRPSRESSDIPPVRNKSDLKKDRSDDLNVDENVVIEKTVVMLDPCPSVVNVSGSDNHQSGEKGDDRRNMLPVLLANDLEDQSDMTSHDKLCNSREVNPPHAHAKLSLLGDSFVGVRSSSAEAPSALVELKETDAAVALVSNLMSNKLDISGGLEKHRGKDSSRGFKRLLKFGRSNHSSSSSSVAIELNEPGSSERGKIAHSDSSCEASVHTLRNLISKDEIPSAATKSSRVFSLLSPFRGKNPEKRSAQ